MAGISRVIEVKQEPAQEETSPSQIYSTQCSSDLHDKDVKNEVCTVERVFSGSDAELVHYAHMKQESDPGIQTHSTITNTTTDEDPSHNNKINIAPCREEIGTMHVKDENNLDLSLPGDTDVIT